MIPINDILTELSSGKYELDLKKILKLSESERNLIISMFSELMDCFYGERGNSLPGGVKIDLIKASILYNTLLSEEYLITKREKNINNILDGENGNNR
jgi:hypothetical protein